MRRTIAAALAAALIVTTLAATAPVFPPWGLTLSYLDPGVPPGNDFFRYANGGWLKDATIPPDRRAAGVNLDVDQGNEKKLQTVMASLVARPDAGLSAEERKLRDFYLTFMDTAAIEAAGLGPVRADLERIAGLSGPAEVAAFMATPATHTPGPYAARITVDEKNPRAYIVRLTQSGLGMPDRDYYLRDDKDILATREAYQRYLATMLALAGVKDPARAAAVYALEARIAEAHWPAAERREAEKTYNLMRVTQLGEFAPQFPWASYLGAAGVPLNPAHGERRLDVAEKSAFPKLAEIFSSTPVAVWRDYLTVRYLHERAEYLPKAFDDADLPSTA
jgi:putative endopeptidase